jgi:3-methyladenine DNA glycosylase/8-oxoguanine DNA glycosylase
VVGGARPQLVALVAPHQPATRTVIFVHSACTLKIRSLEKLSPGFQIIFRYSYSMEHLIHLGKDKKLKKVIDGQEPYILQKRNDVYLHLCSSIMSQQLNTKVAAVIFDRFLNLYKNRKPAPQHIVDTPVETLRGIGLSYAKANYVQNVFYRRETHRYKTG